MSNLDQFEYAIIERVEDVCGCKLMDLVVYAASHFSFLVEDADIPDIIQNLIDEKRLVEVAYVLPNMDYRIKSFILPPGTLVATTALGFLP